MAVAVFSQAGHKQELFKAPQQVGANGLGAIAFRFTHGATPFVGTIKAQRRREGETQESDWKDIAGGVFTEPTSQILDLKPWNDFRLICTAFTSGEALVEVA